MTLSVSIVVGNPKPNSRTLRVAQLLVDKLLGPQAAQAHVIDLAEHTADIFAWPSDRMDELNGKDSSGLRASSSAWPCADSSARRAVSRLGQSRTRATSACGSATRIRAPRSPFSVK